MTYKYFPCVAGGKEPALKGDWRKHATDDEAQIQAWLDQGYNLAIDCEASGLCVIDLDGGEIGEATWQRLQAEHGSVLETYTVRTPRGGRHLYFQGSAPTSVQRLGPKVDTRGAGGYALVPPSTTNDGEYVPLGAEAAVANLPRWIGYSLANENETVAAPEGFEEDLPPNITRAIEFLQQREEASQGNGADARTYQAACALKDMGISKDTSLTLMLEHYRCTPQDERYQPFLERKIENAWGYGKNEPGAWALSQDPSTRFALARPTVEPTFKLWSEEDQDAWEDPEWDIPHFLPKNSVGMIYGSKGSFKSFVATHVSLHLAAGLETMDAKFEGQRAVVYVPFEGPTATGKIRRPAWRHAYGVTEAIPFLIAKGSERPYAANPDSVKRFIEGVRHLRPALIVIDTLHRFMRGLSEIKDEDCSLTIAALQLICESLDCSVLTVHHSGKDSERGARGHSSLTADMDFVHEAIGHRDLKIVEVWNRFQKDADEPEHPWLFELRPSLKSLALHPIDYATLQRKKAWAKTELKLAASTG